jgi:RNA polymerase sigma factor (sigma-70 family)
MSNGNVSDFELWSRFKAGDDIALSLIYEANSRKLYHYGLKFTGNVLLVEDSIQDLFTELIKNRRNLGDTFNISFYLLKSIKRKLLRKLMNEKRISMATPEEDYAFNVTYPAESDMISDEITQQKKALLAHVLQELTPRQKEAIYLRFSKELNYHELSEIMNISVEASRNLISGAVKKLKEALGMKGKIK